MSAPQERSHKGHRKIPIVALVFATTALNGCASNDSSGFIFGASVLGQPGFFAGLLHGLITPIVVLPWLAVKGVLWVLGLNIGHWAKQISSSDLAYVLNDWAIYSPNHSELYPVGYVFGILIIFSTFGK